MQQQRAGPPPATKRPSNPPPPGMVRQRKGGGPKAAAQDQPSATAQPPPTTQPAASVAPQDTPGAAQAQQQEQPRQPPSSLLAATCLAAVTWLLLVFPKAAYHILAPQTGDWLAGLCQVVLLTVGVAATVVSTAAAAAWEAAGLAAVASRSSASAEVPLWLAAVLAPCCKALAQGLGALLLSPGLSLDDSSRVTDTWLTVRSMGLALLACGPVMVSLGLATGSMGSRIPQQAQLHARWLRPALIAALAVRAGWYGWTPGPALLKPACTIPLLVAMLASLSAAAVGALGSSSRSKPAAGYFPPSLSPRWLAAAGIACLAAGHAATSCWPCRHYSPPRRVAGGQYSLLYSCETRLGGHVSVVEGTLGGQYRYRLMRVDHSIVGGEYVAPADVAGQSVYTAFYLQQAILAARPINSTAAGDPSAAHAAMAGAPGSLGVGDSSSGAGTAGPQQQRQQQRRPRSLHVGLGIGTAVKGLQEAGAVADVLELHQEVIDGARDNFKVHPAGRILAGNALATLGMLPDESYDYVIHDVFSGGGAPPALMGVGFLRRLRRKVAPGGVVAVNYVGSRGTPLKELWCRLRLTFDQVRCFGDQERSHIKNYVLFASNEASLESIDATAAELAREPGAGAHWDPAALTMLRTLGKAEVRFTYDRQRCYALLGLDSESKPTRPSGGGESGSGGGLLSGPGTNLPPGLRKAAESGQVAGSGAGPTSAPERRRGVAGEAPWLAGKAPEDWPGLPSQLRGQPQGQQRQQGQQRKQWVVERWKQEAQWGHAMASHHWAVMRRQLDDELWRTY
ncbi:hypothetical protein N2152v2_002957 [Parachlorella kessleri]